MDLNLRLGEGSGAALAMNLVEAAQRILTEIATFDEAHVSKANAMKRLLAAIRFLTDRAAARRLGARPSPIWPAACPSFLSSGCCLGGLAAAIAWGMARIAPPMVAAAVLVVAMLSFSGCLHLDGLSDTADGLLSSRNRQRMLEIMKDSHVGAMGVIAVACVLLLKFASLWRRWSRQGFGRPRCSCRWPGVRQSASTWRCCLRRGRRGWGPCSAAGRRVGAALLAVALLAAAGWATMGVRGLAAGGRVLIAAMLLAAYV